MDFFSSPLGPQMFAHPATTGIFGPITGPSSSIPSSHPSSARLLQSFPLLDAHDSRQCHSSNLPFDSSSHIYQKPNLPDHAGSAPALYDIKPKLQRPGMLDISSSVPRINGTNHNGLPDGKHIAHNGNDSTHSRQGSSGILFVK